MNNADSFVFEVVKELGALHRLGSLDARSHQAALRYIEDHRSEVDEMLDYSSVRDVVDTVVQCAAI